MPYDYSKLDWHDGAPKGLKVGQVMEVYLNQNLPIEYWLVGDLNNSGGLTKGLISYPDKSLKCIRWAWLPGFEEGDSELHPRSTEFSRR
jgi:hypothetical protein